MDADLLEQRLEIETPERVVIVHDLAGIGSRFAAGCVDACILVVPWLLAVCGLAFAMPSTGKLDQAEIQAVVMAVTGACAAVTWLYYLVFETCWGGRTPGKRAFRLRVMSVHGGPAPASAVVLRNVLRLVDMLPVGVLHVAGGVAMFLSPRAQRIGDLAAGTIVVREREEALRVAPARDGAAAGDEFAADDVAEADRFVARRSELVRERRAELAGRIAARLVARYGLPPGPPEKIVGLVAARRTPGEIRALAGPAASPAAAPGAAPAERNAP